MKRRINPKAIRLVKHLESLHYLEDERLKDGSLQYKSSWHTNTNPKARFWAFINNI